MLRVSLGMTEERLLAAVGEPVTIETDAAGKTLRFETWTANAHGRPTYCRHWHVRMVQGRVESFGEDQTIRKP